MSHKLWVYHGGASPRRVVVSLAERELPPDFITIIPTTMSGPGAPAEALGKPPGAVPLLALPTGELIHESLAIITYLEDLAVNLSPPLPSMFGCTTLERAKVNEMLGLIETVTLSIELAAVNGCVLFAPQIEEQQSAAMVRWLMKFVHKNLARIEEYAGPEGPWLVSQGGQGEKVTVADCVLFATLQYALELFGLDFWGKHDRLRRFYEAFGKRSSAVVPEGTWPSQITAMTKRWIEY
jgi:glutathione S-transferase